MKELLLALALLPLAGPPKPEPLPARAVARLGSRRFYHGPGITCLALSPDGKRAASAASGWFPNAKGWEEYGRSVVLWDTATGERLRTLRAPERPVRQLCFSPDGKRLAAVGPLRVAVLDANTGQLLRELSEGDHGPGRAEFTPDGNRLLIGGPRSASAWDVRTWRRVRHWGEAVAGPLQKRESVAACVPSPDGKYLAWLIEQGPDYSKLSPLYSPPLAAARPTTLIITEAASGKRLYRHTNAYPSLYSFAFSRDGRRFVVEGNVFDTASGKKLAPLGGRDAFRTAVSPNGKQAVVVTGASQAWVYSLAAGKRTHELLAGLSYINSHLLVCSQTFSADSKALLLANDTTLRLFDMTTGKERGPAGHRTGITPRFSADGKALFTTGWEERARWRVPGFERAALVPRRAWEGICGNQALAHSEDGRRFLEGDRAGVCVRDTATGRQLLRLDAPPRAFFGLLSTDNARALAWHSTGGGDAVFLYETTTGKKTGEIKPGEWAGYPVFSPGGRLVAWAAHDNTVRLFDGKTGKFLDALRPYRRLPNEGCDDARLAFSPDGRFLAAVCLRGHRGAGPRATFPARVFAVRSGRQIASFHANPEQKEKAAPPSCAAFSPDGRLMAFAEEGSGLVRLIEVASGQARATFDGHKHGVHGLAFSPDGRLLASGGKDNVAFVWDVVGPAVGGWDELAAKDGKRSAAAVAAFAQMGKRGVALLERRLRPAPGVDTKRLASLIAGLVSDSFETREQSERDLAALGEQAAPAMHRMRRRTDDLEQRARLDRLLEKLERTPPPEELRALRGVEALERIGTAEARRVLQRLAKGAPDARLTLEARGALLRLSGPRPR